jgi:hypothetical protein
VTLPVLLLLLLPMLLTPQPTDTSTVVLPFLTHFADLSSWEYAQKLIKVLPQLQQQGVQVMTRLPPRL